MSVAVGLPRLPLLRLHCSTADVVRSVLARVPAWGSLVPAHEQVDGERGLVWYRLDPQSFALQVQFRRQGENWVERDFAIVPGSTVALRLVLGDEDPRAITAALGLQPTRAWARGDRAGRGRPDEGLWIHEVFPRGFHWPEEKVGELLAVLKTRSGWRDVVGRRGVQWAGVTVQLRGCQERMGGLQFEQALLEDLVALVLSLDVQLAAD